MDYETHLSSRGFRSSLSRLCIASTVMFAAGGGDYAIAAEALPTETVLYSFKNGNDGGQPSSGGLVFHNRALYGTTTYGGTLNTGVVFQLSPPVDPTAPWTETVLYGFQGGADGFNPYDDSLVFDTNGALYGTTSGGGTNPGPSSPGGTVFKLTPPVAPATAWTKTTLWTFGSGSDGSVPYTGVIFDTSGALYGVTAAGGAHGQGTVFKLTPPVAAGTGWTETVLYHFAGGSDGAAPIGGLIFYNGALYGTTRAGGAANNGGTVFKLTPPVAPATTWIKTTLWTFGSGSDGSLPYAGVIFDTDGALYGLTAAGGAYGQGAVFKLTPPVAAGTAWTETVLYPFAGGSDGAAPMASRLIFDTNGALYGTTHGGGTSNGGAVFKLTPPVAPATTWTEIVLYRFKGSGGDAATPAGGVVFDTKGALYGMTSSGGTANAGAVFKLQWRNWLQRLIAGWQ